MSPDGGALLYSTYLGGSGNDRAGKIDGVDALRLSGEGDLEIWAHGGVLSQLKPVVYQRAGGGARRRIEGRYVLDLSDREDLHQTDGWATDPPYTPAKGGGGAVRGALIGALGLSLATRLLLRRRASQQAQIDRLLP